MPRCRQSDVVTPSLVTFRKAACLAGLTATCEGSALIGQAGSRFHGCRPASLTGGRRRAETKVGGVENDGEKTAVMSVR